jgi:hypothetical protein
MKPTLLALTSKQYEVSQLCKHSGYNTEKKTGE